MLEETVVPPLHPSLLPEYLYRIDYPGSWTRYTDDVIGFRAKCRVTMGPATITQFTNHLKWKVNIPSRFISTLSSKDYAISWARSLEQYKNPGTRDMVRLMTIKTGCGVGAGHPMYIYNIKEAFQNAGILPPVELREFVREEEYLILCRIPASQVIRIEGIDVGSDQDPTEISFENELELNMPDPREGFAEFIGGMEELCMEMKLLAQSYKLLSDDTKAIICYS
ncbi:hypothetical protein TWF730_006016 [Orbilia blumenaviensis]|uniref:DUF7587 domain-containing protein n=1 Tax=Orbilia blumenaviensis TaxID=1796055 RepID=A0AAV9VK16_9PEZI